MKELRSVHGMTQDVLHDKLHVSIDTIKGWERGAGTPDYEMLQDLSKVFDVSVDYLIGNSDNPREEYKTIYEVTGLSDKAVKELKHGFVDVGVLNAILETKYGTDLFYGIGQYLNPEFTVPMTIEGKPLKDNLLWLGRTDDGKDGYTAVEVNRVFLETLAKETINTALQGIKNDYTRKQRKEGKR